MPDLVEKFFKEDLTEAEHQALSEALLSSDETALKFEGQARDIYLGFGLPDPSFHWPKTTHLPWHSSHAGFWGHAAQVLHHFGHWIWPSVIVVGTTASVTVWHYSQTSPVKPVEQPAVVLPVPTVKIEPKAFPTPAPRVILPPKPAIPTATPLTVVHPDFTPVKVDQNPPASFSKLSVVVTQAKAGSVVVRVTDMKGTEIQSLYQGNLEAGNWAFEWNGLLSDGKSAPAGYYRIEVKAGSFIQQKTIQIQ